VQYRDMTFAERRRRRRLDTPTGRLG
jgi:hypothetical protein